MPSGAISRRSTKAHLDLQPKKMPGPSGTQGSSFSPHGGVESRWTGIYIGVIGTRCDVPMKRNRQIRVNWRPRCERKTQQDLPISAWLGGRVCHGPLVPVVAEGAQGAITGLQRRRKEGVCLHVTGAQVDPAVPATEPAPSPDERRLAPWGLANHVC